VTVGAITPELGDQLRFVPVVVAPFIGSFLGLVVRRLPVGDTIVSGRSRCPHCGRTLSALDLIPVASWLASGGKCRRCGAALGVFYPAIELAAATIALAAVLLTDGSASAWLACGLGWTLLALSWIDAETMLLPDALTLPLVLAGLIASVTDGSDAMLASGLGAVLGFGLIWAVARLYAAYAGRPGLGEGDQKLFAATGAWLGWQALPPVIFASSVLGILATLAAMALGREVTRETRIPFGPFIAAANWLGFVAEHANDDVSALIAAFNPF
jgi:leader peptidase (prepilin peptidase) / N-methyltransferase